MRKRGINRTGKSGHGRVKQTPRRESEETIDQTKRLRQESGFGQRPVGGEGGGKKREVGTKGQ